MSVGSIGIQEIKMQHKTKLSLFIQLTTLFIAQLLMNPVYGEEELLEFVPIEPIIITNYLKKSSKKPGFIQLKAQLIVKEKLSVEKLEKHMPLVRDYIVEYLNFSKEDFIKDVSKRKELRTALTVGIQELLTEQIGEPLVEEFVITQFMWN